MAPVSVRHHLDILLGEGLVHIPGVRRNRSVGRPQQVYALTEAAIEQFPKNFRNLTSNVLEELKEMLPEEQLEELFARVAQRTASELSPLLDGQSVEDRLRRVVEFLNERGYLCRWEPDGEGGYLLSVLNCPYAGVSEAHPELCRMDRTMLELMLDEAPERLQRQAAGDLRCMYRIRPDQHHESNGRRG